jgi:hypothetical protein
MRSLRPVALVACYLTLCAPAGLLAAEAAGTSDEQAQQDAQRQIPFDKLDADARRKVEAVLSDVTLFRRLPMQVFRCDPDLFLFMTTHPDVTVNLWQVLELSQISATRTGKTTFRADDGAGTESDIQYLHTSHDTQLIYAVGNYKGPLFGTPIRGGCLLLLKTGYIREPDGYYYITARLDVFFRVDNVGVSLLTRTLQPLVSDSADKNVKESAAFLQNLSRAAEMNPDYMQHLSTRLSKVRPEDRRRFAELTAQTAERASRLGVRKASHLSEDEPDSVPPRVERQRATIPPPTRVQR